MSTSFTIPIGELKINALGTHYSDDPKTRDNPSVFGGIITMAFGDAGLGMKIAQHPENYQTSLAGLYRNYSGQRIDETEIDTRMTDYNEEKKLLCAVLTDALDCIVRRVADWRKELAWFKSEDTTPVHSFLWICSSLGLEPESIRNVVMQAIDNPEKFNGQVKNRRKCRDLLSTCLDEEIVEDEEEDEEQEWSTSIIEL